MFTWLKQNPITHLTLVMWRYAEGSRKLLVLYSCGALIAVLISLLAPLAMAKVISAVEKLQGDDLLGATVRNGLLYALVGFGFWFFHGPSRVLEVTTAYEIKRRFQVAFFRKVTLLPTRWHKEHHSGETIDQIAKASSALGLFAESWFEVLHISVRFLGSVAFLTWLMPFAGIFVIAVSVLIAVVIVIFDKYLVEQYDLFNKRMNEVAAAIQDYLTNVGTVISLRLEERVAVEVNNRAEVGTSICKKASVINESKWFTTSMLIDGMHVSVLVGYVAFANYSQKPVEIAAVYLLAEYLKNIADSFFRFTWRYGELLTKSTLLRAVDHIEESYDKEVKGTEEARLPDNWRRLDISHINFSHEVVGEMSAAGGVKDISLTLEQGKSYAFVGESGSGKSTLLKILRGLHPVHDEVVMCDGEKLPLGLTHVAHHTTLIPQEPEIFADTIRFNVTLGVEASDELVREALEKARFLPVVSRLAKGLNTDIAEKGVSLSGGEKQRLAVARGLFFVKESNSEIILLDEPTSSVDVRNERLIYETILKEFRSRCIVTAIHKFNLLHMFDEILVFSQGYLIERGTQEALLARNGEFARLWYLYSDTDTQQVQGLQ
jgi:ATP-binding cassette subfamily B protein